MRVIYDIDDQKDVAAMAEYLERIPAEAWNVLRQLSERLSYTRLDNLKPDEGLSFAETLNHRRGVAAGARTLLADAAAVMEKARQIRAQAKATVEAASTRAVHTAVPGAGRF